MKPEAVRVARRRSRRTHSRFPVTCNSANLRSNLRPKLLSCGAGNLHFVIIAPSLRSSALELPEAALTTLRGMKHEATKELLGAPSSDDEERPSKSKWDKVRVLNVESKKSDTVSSPGRSFVRSLSDSFVRPEVAASTSRPRAGL